MAQSSVLSHLSRAAAANGDSPRALLSQYATWRSQRALRAVQRYSGLQERLFTMLRGRRPVVSPTLGDLASAQFAAWRTAVELRSHDDRQLADIEIPREMIGAVATLSAFGWPAPDRAVVQGDRPHASFWARLRRSVLPTREEIEEAYLAGSVDLHDLECRISELDRRKEKPFHA